VKDTKAFAALERRLKTILPEEYQDSYEEVKPVSMGSAGLKYGRDGKVAWNNMWDTFCDLAMAGGPPHKGKLLEPASAAEIEAGRERYDRVVAEICRGVNLVTDLAVAPSLVPGWVRVDCIDTPTAEWLLRAIVMENVSARSDGTGLDVPAGPDYRLEKEIKNVVTVMAKTGHYWLDHTWSSQQREIGELFEKMAVEMPLLEPARPGLDFDAAAHESLSGRMREAIRKGTGLEASQHRYAGWLGITCPDVRSAIWMMRALVASNVLSRREETVLFIPVNPISDRHGHGVVRRLVKIYGFAVARGVLPKTAIP
jgi:sirohydrochlorin cobaltochelatase